MIRRDGPVMHEARIGPLEELLPHQLARVRDHLQRNVEGRQPLGFVAVSQHLAGRRIDLGMRGHRLALQLPAKIVVAARLERIRIEIVRTPVLLHREQMPGMEEGVGVGRRPVLVPHRRIVGVGIPVHAEESAVGLAFELEPLGADIPAAEVNVAVAEAIHLHHTVAIDVDVVAEQRWITGVGSGSIERPSDRRQFAVIF